jgi:hypothetical protein
LKNSATLQLLSLADLTQKAASRRGEAVTKVQKDAEAKARHEAAAVAQEQAAAKAKAEAEANLRPPLLFVLPKISLTDCFRATPNRLLEEAARALYFSPRVIAWALQMGSRYATYKHISIDSMPPLFGATSTSSSIALI